MRTTVRTLLKRVSTSAVSAVERISPRVPGKASTSSGRRRGDRSTIERSRASRSSTIASGTCTGCSDKPPTLPSCTRPSSADGAPIAVVSLRRRPGFWEPASAQCLPGTPIACVPDQLGRVLRGLGREVRIGSLYRDPSDLRPSVTHSYQRYGADLRGDYEAHWPNRGGMNYLVARKKTVGFDVRIDHPGDLEWTVNRWAELLARQRDRRGRVGARPSRRVGAPAG